MERYIAGRYIPSFKKIGGLDKEYNWTILEQVSKAYPNGVTARDVSESTNLHVGKVHDNLNLLADQKYVERLPEKRKGTGAKGSSEFIIEDSSGIINSKFGYQLSPGSVEFSSDLERCLNSFYISNYCGQMFHMSPRY